MSDDEQNALLQSAPMDRRRMLKRLLLGTAAAYSAPVVTSFVLGSPVSAGGSVHAGNMVIGGNMGQGEYPIYGSNMSCAFGSNMKGGGVAGELHAVAAGATTAFETRTVDRIEAVLARAETRFASGDGRRAFVSYHSALRLALALGPLGRDLARALTDVGRTFACHNVGAAVPVTSRDQNLVNQANRLLEAGHRLFADDYLSPAMQKYYLAYNRIDRLT